MPHSIAAIERKLIGEASHVITIGDGLAQTLRSRHGPRIRELTVVRNIPNASTSDVLSRSGGPLRLAYAGLLSPERRIEAMIVALVRLPAIWRLDVTGFGAESYLSTLRALCRSVGVADRVFWHPPAAPESLVERLSESDVGVFLSEGRNGQQRVALPNKIFEYTAAGLAVASAGSDEAGKLLAQHGHGIPLSGATAEALVAGLFGFDRARIDALRIQAAIARRELDWRKEQLRLLAVYDALKRVARSQ